jgi:hypothetical protein
MLIRACRWATGALQHLDFDVIGNLENNDVVLESRHRANHPAGRYHTITLAYRLNHLLCFLLALLLRTNEQKVKNGEHPDNGEQHGDRARTGAARVGRHQGQNGMVHGEVQEILLCFSFPKSEAAPAPPRSKRSTNERFQLSNDPARMAVRAARIVSA